MLRLPLLLWLLANRPLPKPPPKKLQLTLLLLLTLQPTLLPRLTPLQPTLLSLLTLLQPKLLLRLLKSPLLRLPKSFDLSDAPNGV